jgi:hypothetical protein
MLRRETNTAAKFNVSRRIMMTKTLAISPRLVKCRPLSCLFQAVTGNEFRFAKPGT